MGNEKELKDMEHNDENIDFNKQTEQSYETKSEDIEEQNLEGFEDIPEDLESEYDKILKEKEETKEDTEEATEEIIEDVEKSVEEITDDDLFEKDESGEYIYEDIPEEWEAAGKAAGLSDEKIIELAEYDEDVLKALAEFHSSLKAAKTQQEITRPTVTISEKIEEKPKGEKLEHISVSEFLPEDVSPEVKKAFEKQNEVLNSLIDKLNSVTETISESERLGTEEYYRSIDEFFDEHRQECPAVGNSLTLTEKQALAREEIYGIAEVLRNVNGGSIEKNLEKAIKAYNGLYGNPEKIAENNLRRKLYKQKKKFSPRPGGQKTAPKYENEDEEVMAAMTKKAQELGIDLKG